MQLAKTVLFFTYLAFVANGHDNSTSNRCSECNGLAIRLDILEALVRKQTALVQRQADVIKRILLETDTPDLKDLDLKKRVNRRFVLGEGANVAFTAYLGHIMHNMQDKQKLVFEKVVTNEGGFYNNTTGIFTAPESGLYQFIFVIDTYGSYQSEVRLMVDGVYMMEAVAEGRAADHNDQGCNAIHVRLNRGQSVWLEHNGAGG